MESPWVHRHDVRLIARFASDLAHPEDVSQTADMASGPVRDTTIRLGDGRALAYCEWGDASGPAVLAFNGNPGSRAWWPGEDATAAAGVHLITVDRPGYGGSDPLPGRPIAGWADDVAELTESNGIVGFGVVGWSAGAP